MFFKKKKKSVPLSEHKRIIGHLRDEIIRKDKIIAQLKDKNELILGSSLKQAKRNDEILEIVKKLKSKIDDKNS